MGPLCVCLGQCEDGRTVWRERVKYMYSFSAGSGERERDVILKRLIYLLSFLAWAI